MKSVELFKLYENQVTPSLFHDSGMENTYNRLDFGFFPLGSGIFTKSSKVSDAEIKRCRIFVLGNDFGTVKYLNEKCNDNREKESNPTIRNLIGEQGLNLNPEECFFTNFHLGLRKEGTNINRADKLTTAYRTMCFNFFQTQLQFCNPEIILCLGNEVVDSLSKEDSLFKSLTKRDNILKTASGSMYGERQFILIPHPSMAHFNWKGEFKKNMREVLS